MPVERRRAVRKMLEQSVLLSIPGEETPTDCSMKNLTVFGAGISLPSVAILQKFELSFDQFRQSHRQVTWATTGSR